MMLPGYHPSTQASRLGRMRRPGSKRKPASGRSLSDETLREHRLGNVVRLMPDAWSTSPRAVRHGWKRLLEAAEEEAHLKGEAVLFRSNLRRLSTMAARLNLAWGPQLTRIPAEAYPPFLKGEVRAPLLPSHHPFLKGEVRDNEAAVALRNAPATSRARARTPCDE